MTADVEAVHTAFQTLRPHVDPQGHDLFDELERCCVFEVTANGTLTKAVERLLAEAEDNGQVERRIKAYGSSGHIRRSHLEAVE